MWTIRGVIQCVCLLCVYKILTASATRLEVIPERAAITYQNPAHVRDVKISVVRYNRRSPYYINISGTMLKPWQNNVTLHLVFYELLSNEYRRSFIEMKIKVCDLISKDPYIGKVVRRAIPGITCPLSPGYYQLTNMTLVEVDFPYIWPIEHALSISSVYHTDTKEVLVSANVTMRFHQKRDSTKKKV